VSLWNPKIQNSFLEFPKEIHPEKERALQRSERDLFLRFWNLPGLEMFRIFTVEGQIYIKTLS